MPKVIDFLKARRSRPERNEAPREAAVLTTRSADKLQSLKGEAHRAILLLELASQQARWLVKEIADPSKRNSFEGQLASIEQMLQVARQLLSGIPEYLQGKKD